MKKETVLFSYEKSVEGRRSQVLPESDVPAFTLPQVFHRKDVPILPEMDECDVSRHYTELANRAFGVNNGFYPLGSCTMKYNPAVNEAAAALEGFLGTHPLAPAYATEGCRQVMRELEAALCEITGMDAFSLQPAAGSHGEFCGLLCIKAYHEARGDHKRTKMLIPDSAHGTNPATATMAGYAVINVPSGEDGLVDLDALENLLSDEIAGIMLTNPNTLGLFEKEILQISEKIHRVGGLLYYDGANLNAILGVARPGDMGFDVTHLNLHKTFSTPHGGGGPGSGPVGVKKELAAYLHGVGSGMAEGGACGESGRISSGVNNCEASSAAKNPRLQMKAFHGTFPVLVKALTYIMTLGGDNLRGVSEHAVLSANYLMHRLKEAGYTPAKDAPCMHEFVLCLEDLKERFGVSAMDVAKALIDYGIHPPTMYFPLIVHEALMFEPTETESLSTLDHVADVMREIRMRAEQDPDSLRLAPRHAVISRPDEVAAARKPVLRYDPRKV